jgi:hypothetical protein
MKRIAVVAALCGSFIATPAAAQSLFATRGLGVPVAPVDARARALGGVGVGLFGLNTSLVNPAEVAGLGRRGVAAALQPLAGNAEFEGADGALRGTRFPLMRILYPVQEGRLVFSAGYGSYLDQSWGVTRAGTEVIGGQSLEVTDVVQATGGIAQGTLSAAYAVTPRIAVGFGAGLYTGSLERSVNRTFTDVTQDLLPFATQTRWEYSGPFASIGVRWDADPSLRIAASMTTGGDLRARALTTDANDGTFRLPTRVNAGASGWLSPDLLAAVSVERGLLGAGPAQVDAMMPGSQTHGTWRVGGGLEYEGVRSTIRTFPIRLGAQWAELPYANPGESTPTEWSAALGLGFRLAVDELGPLAVVDTSLERGGRSGLVSDRFTDGLNESFWRFTVSLALFGR